MSRNLRLGKGSLVDSFPVEKGWAAGIDFDVGGVVATVTWSGTVFSITANSATASIDANGVLTYAPNASATGANTEVGWRRVQWTTQNNDYAFVQGDRGKGVLKTNNSAYNWTVSQNIFSAGDQITLGNAGTAGAITLVQGTGVTLYDGSGKDSTAGNKVLPSGPLIRRLHCVASNVFIIEN